LLLINQYTEYRTERKNFNNMTLRLIIWCVVALTFVGTLAVEEVQILDWSDFQDIGSMFNFGVPAVVTGSPVTSWPLINCSQQTFSSAFNSLELTSAVRSTRERDVVVRRAKNLPDNRDVLFETSSGVFEIFDPTGGELEKSVLKTFRPDQDSVEGSRQVATKAGKTYWRSINMLTGGTSAATLWNTLLLNSTDGNAESVSSETKLDLQWLFHRLKYDNFDARPSVSMEALENGASTPPKLDARHEVIVQVHGSQECLLVSPADAFHYGYLYPSRHVYDGMSQFHFQLCGVDIPNNSPGCNKGSNFFDPPTLQLPSGKSKLFAGNALRVMLKPGTMLVVPSSWLTQCFAGANDSSDEADSTPVSFSVKVSSPSHAQTVLNRLASDFIPAEWQAMMETVPHFLNSALQGFLAKTLDRLHELVMATSDSQCHANMEYDSICLPHFEKGMYHTHFFKTLLKQRYANLTRSTVILEAPVTACANYNQTHNQHFLEPYIEGAAASFAEMSPSLVEIYLGIWVESYANAVAGVSKAPAYVRMCLCGEKCFPSAMPM
jgi:hypothetical protein